MTQNNMQTMAEALRPLAKILKETDLKNTASAKVHIEKNAPFAGAMIQAIRKSAEKAANEGWLLPKENMGVKFGRVAKDLEGFSVDAVLMSGPGPRHRHGNGEIDLCFTTQGDARFDGHPEGWVIYPPGSVHVPTVSQGEMLILYFLPGAAIEFLTNDTL